LAELPSTNLLGPKPTFDQLGRSYHLRIKTIDDVRHVLELDEAHWVAMSCPVNALHCDEVFLPLLDTDENGRVLTWELRDSIEWMLRVLKNYKGVEEQSQVLHLDTVNLDEADGRSITESAKKMLTRLNADDYTQISLDQIRQIKSQIESMPVSEAGVVLPEATDDEAIQNFLKDIVACLGGVPHPNGKNGVNRDMLNRFLGESQAYLVWRDKGLIPEGETETAVKPFGEQTAEIYAAYSSVREKIDRYFAQCRAVAFDPSLGGRFKTSSARLGETDFSDPEQIDKLLEESLIATPQAESVLPLDDQINPADRHRIQTLREKTLLPILGENPDQLTAEQWEQVTQKLSAFDSWLSGRVGQQIEQLGVDKLREYQNTALKEAVEALIAQSNTTAFVLDNIRLTEKLVLFQWLMIRLLNNFVSFPHLYDPKKRALFEMGTLVMDARRFNFSVKVENQKSHAVVTKNGNMSVLYVEITSKLHPEPIILAVPVTSGGIGNLSVGKRGIFIDLENKLWDARVTQIIENPISLREAVVAPFKRLGAVITGKIESMTTVAEKKLDKVGASTFDQVHTQATAAASGEQQAKPAATTPTASTQGGGPGSLLAGGGIAVAALGSATAYIARTVEMLAEPHIILFVVLGAILSVLIPTTIVAWLKLRRRDLSSILEGGGWAINAHMRLTWKQSRFFTQRPAYPVGSHGIGGLSWANLIWVVVACAILVGGSFVVQSYMNRKPKDKDPVDTEQVDGETQKTDVSTPSSK